MDYYLFLAIINRDILVMSFSLYPHTIRGYVVYDSFNDYITPRVGLGSLILPNSSTFSLKATRPPRLSISKWRQDAAEYQGNEEPGLGRGPMSYCAFRKAQAVVSLK